MENYPRIPKGTGVIPILGTTRLPVRPISRSDQPRIVAETVQFSQNLKENMDTGKIALLREDVQAVREVAGKLDAAEGDRYPRDYMRAFSANTPLL